MKFKKVRITVINEAGIDVSLKYEGEWWPDQTIDIIATAGRDIVRIGSKFNGASDEDDKVYEDLADHLAN